MDRRTFIKTATAVSAIAIMSPNVFATDLTPLNVSDPVAISLKYVEDATTATADKYESGQSCAGCVFYQGVEGEAAGGCGVFAGKTVNSSGWCNAWTKKG